MRSTYDRNREELESVLGRVARSYAKGKICKDTFDSFANLAEQGFAQLAAIEEEEQNGQAEVHPASRD